VTPAESDTTAEWAHAALPLFPLRTVLFPGGTLALKVFESRYLDLVSRCLRTGEAFGVVCITQGEEVGAKSPGLRIESVGVLAHITDVDGEQAGILHVRCTGTRRFRLAAAPQQQPGGLWCAAAEALEDDLAQPPATDMQACVQTLVQAVQSLQAQGHWPSSGPLRLGDAGWVANRWCELLPISLSAKQKLMELPDPHVRLRLVDQFLRSKQVLRD
jgi:Lon protease-like protein